MEKYIQFWYSEPEQHLLHDAEIYQDKPLVLIKVTILEYISFDKIWDPGWSKATQKYDIFSL